MKIHLQIEYNRGPLNHDESAKGYDNENHPLNVESLVSIDTTNRAIIYEFVYELIEMINKYPHLNEDAFIKIGGICKCNDDK